MGRHTCECDIEAPDIHRFSRVDGLSKVPPGYGRHIMVSELRYTNTYDSMGNGLDHAFIVHFDELICVMCVQIV